MLALSRKVGERIIIGSNIIVTVTEVRGDRVKPAFQAPPEVPILREEVFQRQGFGLTATAPHLPLLDSPFIAECA